MLCRISRVFLQNSKQCRVPQPGLKKIARSTAFSRCFRLLCFLPLPFGHRLIDSTVLVDECSLHDLLSSVASCGGQRTDVDVASFFRPNTPRFASMRWCWYSCSYGCGRCCPLQTVMSQVQPSALSHRKARGLRSTRFLTAV